MFALQWNIVQYSRKIPGESFINNTYSIGYIEDLSGQVYNGTATFSLIVFSSTTSKGRVDSRTATFALIVFKIVMISIFLFLFYCLYLYIYYQGNLFCGMMID